MKQWFAVQSKPRSETLAEENLIRQGYEIYCPRIRQERRRRGRWHAVTEPLFPRYLFVQLEEGQDNFAPIRSTYGVAGLVRFGGVPKALPPGVIDEIRAREDRALGMHVSRPRWRPGMAVEVIDGALAGLKGLFEAESGAERVVILLRMLGRDNRVTVARDDLVPA